MTKKTTLIILVCILLSTNIATLLSIINERNTTNEYVKDSFDDCIESLYYSMIVIEKEIFTTNDKGRILKVLDLQNNQLMVIEKQLLNLRCLDYRYNNYGIFSLITYIDMLSEKKTLSEKDLETLKEIISLSKDINRAYPKFKTEGYLIKRYYPADKVTLLLSQISDISKNNRNIKNNDKRR